MTNRISVYFKEENLTDLGHYKRLTTSCRCLSEISGHWIDFLQIEAAFRKTNYTTFSYLLIPMYGQDMSEISFFTVCSGCSIFTDIWASDSELKGKRRYSSSAKSRKFTNVCTVGGRFVPPPPQTCTFKLGNLTNFWALFPVVSMDFPELVHTKSWKRKCSFLQAKSLFSSTVVCFWTTRLVNRRRSNSIP